jgi:hypothetical protein
MISSSYVLYKIWKGSKSAFAYVLMAFTLLDGAQFFFTYFIFAYSQSLQIGDQKVQALNPYAYLTAYYAFYLVSLQPWFFGIKYLESAMCCSLIQPCISPRLVKIIGWVVTIVYTSAMVILWTIVMSTFPGFVNNDSFD